MLTFKPQRKKSLVQLFFGAFCVCFGEKVLLLEQKIFLQIETEIFSQINEAMTIIH